MKLSLEARVLHVAAAEAACVQSRVAAQDSRTHLVAELRRVSTPLRIVVSGLTLGVFSGLSVPRLVGKAAPAHGGTVTAPLFALVMETMLPALMAGLTAGQVAGDEVENAADDVADEVADQVVAEVADTAGSGEAALAADAAAENAGVGATTNAGARAAARAAKANARRPA